MTDSNPRPSTHLDSRAAEARLQSNQTSIELTPGVLSRVKAGVNASRHPAVRQRIERALAEIGAIANGETDQRVSGWFRRWVMRRLLKTLFCIRIENRENIPQYPVILTPNHLGHIDPFLVLASVPSHPYYYILGDARTLYNKRWKRWLIGWAGGVIPLERWWKEEIAVVDAAHHEREDLQVLATEIENHVPNGSSIQQLRQIDQAIQVILSRGDAIMLFPEGRLGETEGEIYRPLKRGTVIYAMRAGVPIVPVALIGTQDLYLRKTLTLRFGHPLKLPQQKRPKRPDIDDAILQLEVALQNLLPNDYQEPNGIKLFRRWLNHLFW